MFRPQTTALGEDHLCTLRRATAMAHTTGAIGLRLSAGGVTIADVVPHDDNPGVLLDRVARRTGAGPAGSNRAGSDWRSPTRGRTTPRGARVGPRRPRPGRGAGGRVDGRSARPVARVRDRRAASSAQSGWCGRSPRCSRQHAVARCWRTSPADGGPAVLEILRRAGRPADPRRAARGDGRSTSRSTRSPHAAHRPRRPPACSTRCCGGWWPRWGAAEVCRGALALRCSRDSRRWSDR